ncbi:MAG: CofH family radical SAM protein [Bacteroidales bacterium]
MSNAIFPEAGFLPDSPHRRDLEGIAAKVQSGVRLEPDEGILLYREAPLGWLGMLATMVRQRFNGNTTWYNRNYHIEPTNRCIYNCRFCSYNERNSRQSWDYDIHKIAGLAQEAPEGITEIHIVGGVAPGRGTDYYASMLKAVRQERPGVHLKAYSAIEISYMARLDGISLEECLNQLKNAGLQSIPGGGAEIFDPEVRLKICPEKDDAVQWLLVHETAHKLGIQSNATILYGHLETYAHRIDHLARIRELQDHTGGFNAFIPLKFKNANNPLSFIDEVPVIEDLRNYAVTRIFLDNVPHLKAYWPMIGRETAQLSQHFGVDDLDGTIHDSTKIYSEAGSAEQNPDMDVAALEKLIRNAGFVPAERDSAYKPL